MKLVLTHYAGWFNRKYRRSGALIANRYKSECVEDERCFFSLVRYIHQKPLKAGIVEELGDYAWSSFCEYVKGNAQFIDIDFILDTISLNRKNAIKEFVSLHSLFDGEVFVPTDSKTENEEWVRRTIVEFLDGKKPNYIATLKIAERNKKVK